MTSIFLSYARGDDVDPFDPATSFVARLHRDLTARGFEVWFDRSAMPSRGLTFHQEIQDAVAARERLVLVVGPKAALSDYVRQEWQYALHADKAVTPILRQGDYSLVPDELKLLHCEDFRDDVQYAFHLDNLVRQLREPVPPLGKLIAVPSLPAHYLTRADRLRTLRDALRADLDRPVVITGAAARVGVHGMGGIGKSVLANALVRDRKVREAFPDGIVWVGVGALPTLVELQRRVHRDLGGDGAFLTEHEGKQKLKEILANPSVLLILDDVWRRSDADAFDVLGPRCRALITTRDAGLLTSLGGTHHVVELLTDDEAVRLLSQATGIDQQALPAEALPIIAECGRLPLAVALCGGMIRRGLGWRAVLGQLQQARIDRIADRHSVEPQHESVWNAIHVSVEFLPPDERKRFLELAVFPPDETTPEAAIGTLWAHTGQLDDWGAQELLVTLGERSLVQLVTNTSEPGQPPYRHASLHDLVHDYVQRAITDAKALHEQLLNAYQAKCTDGWPSGPKDGYFFTHLRQHLIAAGRASELTDLLHQLRWLEAKHQAGVVFDLFRDYQTVLANWPGREKEDRWEAPDGPPDDSMGAMLLQRMQEANQHSTKVPVEKDGSVNHRVQAFARFVSANVNAFGAQSQAVAHRALNYADSGPVVEAAWQQLRVEAAVRDPSEFLSRRPPFVARQNLLRTLAGHDGPVAAIHLLADEHHAISRDHSGNLCMWDVGTGERIRTQKVQAAITTTCVASRGTIFAIGTDEQRIELWDARTWQPTASLATGGLLVCDMAFDAAGATLVTGGLDGEIELWDTRRPAKVSAVGRHPKRLRAVALTEDGLLAVSGGDDAVLRVWDVAQGNCLAELNGHRQRIRSVWIAPDGHYAVSGADDWTVRLWDLRAHRCIQVMEGHTSGILSVAASPGGRLVISTGRWDRHLIAWNTGEGICLRALSTDSDFLTCSAWVPFQGGVVVAGYRSGLLRVWDLIPLTESTQSSSERELSR